MSMQQQNNTTEESMNKPNPFLVMTELNALMNTLNAEENSQQYEEEENGNFWSNFICFNKFKKKSDHEKLKETYQDVKKMADSYFNQTEDDSTILKKFIV